MEGAPSRPRAPVLPRVVLGLMALALVVVVALDWNRVRPVLSQANWHIVLVALILTAFSYLCSSSGFAVLGRAFGLPVPMRRLRMVGFVTMAANNLLTLGGAAGYSVSAVLLKRREVPLKDILAASLFHSYVYFLTGTSLLPVGLAYAILSHRLSGRVEFLLTVMVILVSLLAVAVNLAVLWRAFRKAILRSAAALVRVLTRRDPAAALSGFDESLATGLNLLRQKPGRIVRLAAFVLGDWSLCLAALWFCFAALGGNVHVGTLLSGFFIGIAAGAASMIPGGLGIQEGSMAGIYALLGVPFELALLAAILFRVVYYLVPFAVGLFVYRQAIKETH